MTMNDKDSAFGADHGCGQPLKRHMLDGMTIKIQLYKHYITERGYEAYVKEEEGTFSDRPWDFTGYVFVNGKHEYAHWRKDGTAYRNEKDKGYNIIAEKGAATHHHDRFDDAMVRLVQTVKATMEDNTRLRSYIRRARNDVANGVLDAGDAFHMIVGYALPDEPLTYNKGEE